MADPFKFDEKAFNDKLNKQEKFLLDFSGKRGYNPYHQIEEIKTMRAKFANGDRTEALYKQAQAMVEKLEPVTSTEEPAPEKVPGKHIAGPTGATGPTAAVKQ